MTHFMIVGPSGWKFTDGTSKKLPAGSNIAIPARKRSLDNQLSDPGMHEAKKQKKAENKSSIADSGTIPGTSKLKAQDKKQVVSAEQERNKSALKAVLGTNTWSRNVQGVIIEDLEVGTGKKAESGKKVKVFYSGKLKSTGKVFDASLKKPFAFRLGRSEVIKGWDIGVSGMCVGGKRRITCPPEKAYGRAGAPPTIPPNSTLIFDVTLIDAD